MPRYRDGIQNCRVTRELTVVSKLARTRQLRISVLPATCAPGTVLTKANSLEANHGSMGHRGLW